MSVTVHRDVNHPWTGAPGWDHLLLSGDSLGLLADMVRDAEDKFWQVWMQDPVQPSGCHQVRAMLYKPAGASAHWRDEPRLGTPRARCLAIAVGDEVYTDYTGRITQHCVVERQTREFSGHVSQTDCQLRVSPPVKGSGYVTDDPKAKIRQKGLAWMDAAWFRVAA